MFHDFVVVLVLIGLFVLYATRSKWIEHFYAHTDSDEDGELKCIVTDTSGTERYCVRVRKNMTKAAVLLEQVSDKCERVVAGLVTHYPGDERWARLRQKFDKRHMNEILPTNSLTALTKNKGEMVSFCLNKEKGNDDELIDFDTLFFVALHELTHIATTSTGHETDFWDNFRDLLHATEEMGLYKPVDYKSTPGKFCSLPLTDNPYYDHK